MKIALKPIQVIGIVWMVIGAIMIAFGTTLAAFYLKHETFGNISQRAVLAIALIIFLVALSVELAGWNVFRGHIKSRRYLEYFGYFLAVVLTIERYHLISSKLLGDFFYLQKYVANLVSTVVLILMSRYLRQNRKGNFSS